MRDGAATGAARREDAARFPSGFDFTTHVRALCEDICRRLDALAHVDMRRVEVGFAQTRTASRYGMYASLTPLRFPGGREETCRRGRRWRIQKVIGPDGREALYLLNFYLPRFLDLPLIEKLHTVVHELWHIGPRFDGDSRRFGGRCHAHSGSQARYDACVARLVQQWLAANPPEPVYAFLRFSFAELAARYGRVYGRRVSAPKLYPVD